MTVEVERARSLLGQPELGWLVERCRERLSRGQPLEGTVTLTAATTAQREAADRLLGRRPTRGTSLRLELDQLARVLRDAGIADRLEDAVAAVTGPVDDLAAARAAKARQWAQLFGSLRAAASSPSIEAYADDLEGSGLLRRLADGDVERAERLARQAMHVVAALPAAGLPLARFAASTVGDSHGLDPGRPVATLALRAIQHLTGHLRSDRGAAERRALWARVGVLCDELSGAALVHALVADGDGPTDVMLRTAAAAAEPVRVTLRQLVHHPPTFAAERVWVCENPAVVALAADLLGRRCPPLVCTDGQPSGAVQTLLSQLTAAGALLTVHADLDWGGIRIVNFLVDRFHAEPWRMGVDDYLAAPEGIPLRGRPASAVWTDELTWAMRERGTAVHEEQVADALLGDLAADPPLNEPPVRLVPVR
jgi:uncharacterized protein (TIGR02679 family)